MRTIINQIKQDLELSTKVHFIWREKDVDFWGETIFYPTYALVIINTNLLGDDMISTIKHELRHVWQYEYGLLEDIGGEYVRWKKRIYKAKDSTHERYCNQPWEKDAIRYESKIL